MRYDHASAVVRREFPIDLTGAAAVGRFAAFAKLRLKAVHTLVVVAGTNVANNTVLYAEAGVAIATHTPGTNTAGSVQSTTGLDQTVEAKNLLTATRGSDATARAISIFEYEVFHDAVLSA